MDCAGGNHFQITSLWFTANGFPKFFHGLHSFFNYVLLTVVYGSTFIIRRKTLKVRWYYYLLLAILDVEGNFSVVKAYQYTSLTSVMLLDCWTIPCVLLLIWLFIKTKYNIGQLIGVCICILGLVLVILSDVHAKDRSGGSNVLLGDALVIIGAILYAFTNVSEEFLIKNVDFLELMTFLGLFGSIISGIQVAIQKRKELANTSWNRDVILSFSGSDMQDRLEENSECWMIKV
ncbi:hypothetical protein KP509_38G000600 [Ceratopteris richardii]|uniref:Solute carrier family 35 member F1 n=1 Tax=Ceratopteris richardii TaxID=49495 RepID=A0A8T2Q1X4_CERRI|nr:hypothetical protein KP509_38G000600 [Ceratopteris richardii]